MFDFDPFACGGGAPKTRESSEARTARIVGANKSQGDLASLRSRRKRLAAGRTASSLFGGGEAQSLLGAG